MKPQQKDYENDIKKKENTEKEQMSINMIQVHVS